MEEFKLCKDQLFGKHGYHGAGHVGHVGDSDTTIGTLTARTGRVYKLSISDFFPKAVNTHRNQSPVPITSGQRAQMGALS